MAVQSQINMTAINAALKEMYDGQGLVELGYRNHPFYALVEKKTDFYGRNYPLPVRTSPSAGVSNTFSNAQANIASPALSEFLLTAVTKYGVAQIDRRTLLASASDKGAFMSGVKIAVGATTEGVVNAMCTDFFRDGTGAIGTNNGISTGVITLSVAQDVVNFELNQKLNAVTAGSPRGASGFVIAVDRTAGTVTVATTLGGAAATPASWTSGDTLCRDGDNASACAGLQAWLPTTAPSATLFFGVDRSADPVRLAGVRYDGSAQSIEEALIDGAKLAVREGGVPDVAILGPDSFAALAKSLSTRLVYGEAEMAEFSFQYIKLSTPAGAVKAFQDMNCPAKTAFLLQMDTWALYSTGDAPQIVEDMGTGQLLRMSTTDAGELRVAAYFQLGCNAPGKNAVVKLGA